MPEFQRPEPRILGSASSEIKEKMKKSILDNFGEAHYDQLTEKEQEIIKSKEKPKEQYELAAIESSNKITNKLLEEFGLVEFDIPAQNIHILPEEIYKEAIREPSIAAATKQREQVIILNADAITRPLDRVTTIFHEMVHLKNYISLEAAEGLRGLRRSGLNIYTTEAKEEKTGGFNAFRGLNEAVVSEMEKMYSLELQKGDPFLKEEYAREMSTEAIQKRVRIAEANNIDVNEICSVGEDGRRFSVFPYRSQRKVLNYVVDALYADNENAFESRDEVMKLFFKAHFDGNIVPIARSIEKTFGKGSFRILGMMDDMAANSANMVMDYLAKHKKK